MVHVKQCTYARTAIKCQLTSLNRVPTVKSLLNDIIAGTYNTTNQKSKTTHSIELGTVGPGGQGGLGGDNGPRREGDQWVQGSPGGLALFLNHLEIYLSFTTR